MEEMSIFSVGLPLPHKLLCYLLAARRLILVFIRLEIPLDLRNVVAWRFGSGGMISDRCIFKRGFPGTFGYLSDPAFLLSELLEVFNPFKNSDGEGHLIDQLGSTRLDELQST